MSRTHKDRKVQPATKPRRAAHLKHLSIGPGGLTCACCFPQEVFTRRKLFRAARRLEAKAALQMELAQ